MFQTPHVIHFFDAFFIFFLNDTYFPISQYLLLSFFSRFRLRLCIASDGIYGHWYGYGYTQT